MFKTRAQTLNFRVTSTKSLLERKNIEHKMFLLEKPLLLRQGKELIRDTVNDHFKQIFKIKSWLKLIHLLLLVKIGKNFLDVFILHFKKLLKLLFFSKF